MPLQFKMEVIDRQNLKYSFSGHDTFQCRQLWLKKGYEYVKAGLSFNDEAAVVILGVGKNMVSAIHYWMKAFDLLDIEGKLTAFAEYIFDEGGKDPYLEDEASLWLLHYHLINKGLASTYTLIFNEFRRERIEFTKESFIFYVRRKLENHKNFSFNAKTVATDFEIFVKMYKLTNVQSKDAEDTLSGLFTELNLLKFEVRKVDDKGDTYYYIDNVSREEIPDEIILYGILSHHLGQTSISLSNIENGKNSVGAIFALNRASIVKKLESLIAAKKYAMYGMTLSDSAGIRELQFKVLPSPFEILNDYYDQ